MRKKIMLSLLVTVLCSGGFITFFTMKQYYLDNHKSVIQSQLVEWINHDNEEDSFTVLDVYQLGKSNSYLVLFETKDRNSIGYAHYHEGWNGKLKPINYKFGTDKLIFEEVNTNEGKYGVVLGYNPNSIIDHIIAPIVDESISFHFDVSNDEWFLKFEKLPSEIKHRVYANLKAYDRDNEILEYTALY
ncbi:hypothetical protein [Ornithinibacillus xuwenensis]|uniref:DUF4825 domain-containing protein n=1 Tax=Ornithinibacillus xuwenensis TaxID=3144668 RepID=A0ABU9XJK1_9BACI